MTVQLDDAHAQALADLVKGKVADLLKAQDDLAREIREWENICAALVAAPAPPMSRPIMPQGAGAAVKEGAESNPPAPSNTHKDAAEEEEKFVLAMENLPPAKPPARKKGNTGRQFPYKQAQKYEVGKNTIWVHGDIVAIARKGYDKKARLTLPGLRNMDEEKLRMFGNDKARAVLRIVMNEVDFSSMPPRAKNKGVATAPLKETKFPLPPKKGQEQRVGNSEYITCPEGIAVSRDGYHRNHVYLSYPDFFSLVENPGRVSAACAGWHKPKRSLLVGFLKDLTPDVVAQIRAAQVGQAQAQDDPDEWKYKKILKTDTRVGKEDYTKIEGSLKD